jgi:hypothetical protein
MFNRSFCLGTSLVFALLAPPVSADPTAPSINQPSLNQTLDSFQPTPRQTIALRDFLGHTDKIVPIGQQANGAFLFDLRDAQNQRTGQIATMRDDSESTIFIARVSGPAIFDTTRQATAPRVLDPKIRGAIAALLAGAEAGPRYEALVAKYHDLFLRDRPLMALTPQPVAFPDRIIESEASFFSDGSGFFRSIRAPASTATNGAIHVAAKFYPILTADGQKAFRDTVLGVDADFTATLADLGNRLPCPPAGCPAAAPIVIKGEVHLTRWPHAIVPSAPAGLIARISPPPPALPDILQDPQTAPQQPGSIDASGQSPAVPPRPSN